MADDGRGLKFGTVAEQYDRYRPDPPPEAAALFDDLHGLDVLEVGAGTGKLTRFLLELGADLSIIEPDDDMRRVLLRRSPRVHALKGRAEEVPADDASFDAAFSSSAWHWFRQPDTIGEMARVLRDHGTLCVLWNGFSRDVPWMAELTALRERPADANSRPRGWRGDFPSDGPFVDVRDVSLDWTFTRSVDDVVALFSTYSGAIIQSDEERRGMANAVRVPIAEHVSDGVVPIPMTLRETIARRRLR